MQTREEGDSITGRKIENCIWQEDEIKCEGLAHIRMTYIGGGGPNSSGGHQAVTHGHRPECVEEEGEGKDRVRAGKWQLSVRGITPPEAKGGATKKYTNARWRKAQGVKERSIGMNEKNGRANRGES